MRISLVNPPMTVAAHELRPHSRVTPESGVNTFPIGLAGLGGLARSLGHTVAGVDMPYLTFEESVGQLVEQRPDLVGMSCWTGTHQVLLRLAAAVKERLPSALVVFGGHHATLFPDQLMLSPHVDACVIGEGEEAFPALLSWFERGGQGPLETQGIVVRTPSGLHSTGRAERIRELDRYPRPSYDLFQLPYDIGDEQPYGARWNPAKNRRIALLAARGCPFKCTFCVDGRFYSRVASRQVAEVVDEIEFLHKEYDVGLFEFSDMTFTLSQPRTESFCREIIERGLDISWQAMTRVNCVSPALLELMRQAGCYSVSFGVETGSPELLVRLKKQIRREQIVEAFQRAHAAGLSTIMLLMVGNIGETEATIADTIDLLYEACPTRIDVNLFEVYPGSAAYNELVAAGWISDSYWLDHDVPPAYDAEHSIAQLHDWQRMLYYHHQYRPRERDRLLRRAIQAAYRMKRQLSRHPASVS